jgi:hypothetical protein
MEGGLANRFGKLADRVRDTKVEISAKRLSSRIGDGRVRFFSGPAENQNRYRPQMNADERR